MFLIEMRDVYSLNGLLGNLIWCFLIVAFGYAQYPTDPVTV